MEEFMWERKETRHYVFHFRKGSTAEKDIDIITETQERCFEHICKVLNVSTEGKISYFLCGSPEEVGELYGDNEPSNGIVKYPDTIYAVYNDEVKCIGFHEDVHLIAYNTLGNPPQALLREGLAMFFDKVWWGIPNEVWVQVFLKTGLYQPIESLKDNRGFFQHNEVITYPIAGAFVAYLISVFGIEKFKSFYGTVDEDFAPHFRLTFGNSIHAIENDFTRYLNLIRYDEFLERLALEHLQKAGIKAEIKRLSL